MNDNGLPIVQLAEELREENDRLRDLLREAAAMLEIYYVPNSDGSRPTLERIYAELKS